MKLRLKDFSSTPDSQKEITFQIEVEKVMRPWRQFLQAQKDLKTLIWINDAESPWTLVRRDFVELATQNSALESVMVAVHGDKDFRKAHGLPEEPVQPNKGLSKNYQIDAAVVHGMTGLRILSIGCYGKDPQAKHFSLSNLHLLPGTLETVQFFGIRVMATDLESLAKLPQLQTLTLVQGRKMTYTEEDELNDNIEGVTATVLKALLTKTRALDKLVIIGFPISVSKAEMLPPQRRNSNPQSRGWFEGIFGGMCYPSLVDEDDASSNANAIQTDQLASLAQYSEPLQELMTEFVSAEIGSVSDVSSDDNRDHLLTMLTIG